MITKTKFFETYGHRLVKVALDDTETGDYMLMHPEEKWKASDYIQNGYQVASVYETNEDPDYLVVLDNDVSEHPYKVGYIVITKE